MYSKNFKIISYVIRDVFFYNYVIVQYKASRSLFRILCKFVKYTPWYLPWGNNYRCRDQWLRWRD